MNGVKIMWMAVATVAVVVLIIMGYAWGASRANMPGISTSDYKNGFNAGMAAAKKKLTESGLIPPSPQKIMSIAGTVKSVGSDRFDIKANPVSINPLDEQGPTERTVIVTDKTQITARIPMTPDESAAAMKLFQENMKAGKAGSPPAPFTEKKTELDSIKIGMIVTVTAAEDIKNAATINATNITFDALPSTNPIIK